MRYDDLIYLTETEMSKNIIWILVIGFVLGFISYEQLSNFSTTEGNASFWEIISALGSLLVPIVLAIWAWYSEHQKNKKAKREKDREIILTYVREELIPLTSDKYKFKEHVEEDFRVEIKYLFENCYNKLGRLKQITDISSYSYMGEHLNLLIELTFNNVFFNDLSKQDLLDFHKGISSNINDIRILLLHDEEQYKKNVLLGVYSFIEFKGEVRDFTLEFFKNCYPLYYDYAQNGLKLFSEMKQEIEKAEKEILKRD